MTRTATTVLALSLLTPLLLAAQIEWQRVDQTSEGPINRAFLWDMTVAPDGATLVTTGNGIHRIEESGGTFSAVRTDSLLIGWFLETWGEDLFMSTDQAIYHSVDDGRSWDEVLRWSDARYPSHTVAAIGNELVVPDEVSDTLYSVIDTEGATLRQGEFPARMRDLYSTSTGTLILHSRGAKITPLYRSVDSGRTWDSVPTVWPAGFPGALTIQALDDQVIYVNSVTGPDYLSFDGGLTFDSLADPDLTPIRVLEDGTVAGIRPTPSNEVELVTTADNGQSWLPCSPASPYYFTFIGRDGRRVTQGDRIPYISMECGTPFVPVESGFRNVEVATLMEHEGIFYARMAVEHYRSDDGGITWNPIDPFFHLDELGNLYARSDSLGSVVQEGDTLTRRFTHVLISRDRGETWAEVLDEPFLTGRETPDIRIWSEDGGTILVETHAGRITSPSSRDIRYSTDGGATFTRLEGWSDTGRFRPFALELSKNGTVLATGGRYDLTGQYLDFGVNSFDPETREEEWLGGPDFNFIHVGESGSIYGWKIATFYRSDDGGRTWIDLDLPEPLGFPSDLVEVGRGALFASNDSRTTLYISRDRGESWEEFDPETPWDIPNPPVENSVTIPEIVLPDGTIIGRIHIDRDDPFFGTTDYYHYHTIGISEDGGRTWEFPGGELLDRKDVTAVVYSEEDQTLLVGTRDNGLYRGVFVSGVEEVRLVPVEMDLR